MTTISMLAVDLSKGGFQVYAVGPDGTVLYNRALSQARFAALLADQPACVVAMEACATSHHWGRVAQASGHEVRLVPAVYVKPFVKRQKNDRADAEAIAEAAAHRRMRFVAVKSAETQGRAVAFRTHQCLVRQRTQLINALRGQIYYISSYCPPRVEWQDLPYTHIVEREYHLFGTKWTIRSTRTMIRREFLARQYGLATSNDRNVDY